jgi:LysM repeat protein
MITHFTRKTLKQLGVVLLSLALALAVLAASLPQPVQAATDTVACDTYYTVKAGDTTGSIAQHFGLKWKEIADANNLKYPYKLKVGQKLCIPAQNTTNEKITLSVVVRGGSVIIKASKASTKSVFNIKVRAGNASVGGWYKIGSLKVPKTTAVTGVYSLPKDLLKISPITVCLKNASTDQLICRTVVHQ